MENVTPITKKRKPKAAAVPLTAEQRRELKAELVALAKDFHGRVSTVGARYGIRLVETVDFKIET